MSSRLERYKVSPGLTGIGLDGMTEDILSMVTGMVKWWIWSSWTHGEAMRIISQVMWNVASLICRYNICRSMKRWGSFSDKEERWKETWTEQDGVLEEDLQVWSWWQINDMLLPSPIYHLCMTHLLLLHKFIILYNILDSLCMNFVFFRDNNFRIS